MMAVEVDNKNLLTVDRAEHQTRRGSLVKQGSGSRSRNKPKVKRSVSMVKRQFRYRKPVCPFIASTFLDFQVCLNTQRLRTLIIIDLHFKRLEDTARSYQPKWPPS